MNELKIVVFEPGKSPYMKKINNSLEELQKVVAGNIDIIGLPNGIDVVLNDDGLCENLPFNRYLLVNDYILPLVGTFLVVGCNHRTGETISLNDKQVQEYLDYEQANYIR